MKSTIKVFYGVAIAATAFSPLSAAAAPPPAPAVSVVALYRERIMLPPGAVLSVRLADQSRGAGEHSIATATLLNPHVPVDLNLRYDPSSIDPTHTYVVSARITSDGELWFATGRPANVITLGNPKHVELLLERVTSDSPANLEDRQWKLSETHGRQVSSENAPFIYLNDGRVSGYGGCNRFAGSYEIHGNEVALSPLSSTLMSCAQEGVTQQEYSFLDALHSVRYWSVTGGRLELLNGAHKTLLVLISD